MRPDRLFAAYVFDLDGTIYLGDELLPGVQETIGRLRASGVPVRFLSNNPTKDPEQYADKLGRLGLPTPVYHHHRLIRDDQGKRLAKRDDARALSKYRAEGATPADIRRMIGLPNP